ncbi:MAG: glycosyl hydrolase [Rhodocyclaceae bacterium]|nr:glycosyl hydrolase [Rhodocyclaceae bacterium]
MLKAIGKFGRGAQLVSSVGTSLLPVVIIGGLLYAALFVKAEPAVDSLAIHPIERRDVFYGLTAPGAGTLWAVGSYGKIVRSDDGGQSWRIQPTPVVSHLQAIAAWDGERAVAVGNRGLVVITADGGKTWKEAQAPRSEVANKLMQVRAYPGGVAWAVGEVGAVLRSLDYGTTWERVMPEKDQAWNDIFFDGPAGWMVGEFGQILRTTDGGANWAPVESPAGNSLMSVHFRDERHGVAVGLSGTALVTADGGQHWRQAPQLTREHLNCVVWDGRSWVAVGDKGIRVTADAAGKDWKAGRIDERDLSWHTQIVSTGDAHVLAGANLSVLRDDALHVFGRD